MPPQKTSQKRPLPADQTPTRKYKKLHLDHSEKKAGQVKKPEDKKKRAKELRPTLVNENGIHNSKTKMKRSKPVTQSLGESEDETDEEGEEDEDEPFDDGDIDMDVDENTISDKKLDTADGQSSSRESHKVQKSLLSQRRSQKPHGPLLSQAKQTWSLLRQKSLSSAKRQEHLQTLMSLLNIFEPGKESNKKTKNTTPKDKDNTKLSDLILNHSFSRIIQTLLKYSSPSQRELIAQHLEGSYKQLSESRYSRFLVCKILKFASVERRRKIMAEFEGSVVRMVRHGEAGKVLGDVFEVWAGEWERAVLVRDFFGKEVMMFGLGGGGFIKSENEEEKEKAKRGLKGLLGGLDLEKRKRILGSTKENLLTIFNNTDKSNGVTHAIVHRALREYLSVINDITIIPSESEQEKLRREILESCQEVLADMVHTKDGSRAVREFLAWGTAKDRKQILKVLKPHIENMCLDDEAQLVLFTALDVIDDTKLLSKMLVDPIVSCANTLYAHIQGRRSLLYLLVPRSRRHFTPSQIACLEETDAIRERTSKKSREAREDEVRSAASGELVGWVEKDGGKIIREASGCLVLVEIMLYAQADKKGAIRTLLNALSPSEIESASETHPDLIIDLPPASRLYKALLQGGHYNHSTKRVEQVSSGVWDGTTFAVRFVAEIGRSGTVGMCVGTGNGAFVVAEMVEALNRGLQVEVEVEDGGNEDEKGSENGRRGDVEEARKTVKGWFGSEVVEEVERSEAKGKKVLLEKLRML